VNQRHLLAVVAASALAVVGVVAAARAQNAAVDKAIATKSPADGAAAPWIPARLPDGKPDVSGFWTAEVSRTYSLLNPRKGGVRLQEQLL